MTKKKDITVTHQKWRHTLVLQIPTLTKVGEIPLPECDFELSCQEECLTERSQLNDYLLERDLANTNFCPILRNETIKLNQMRTQFLGAIQESIGSIRRLIPVVSRNLTLIQTQRESRSKRALEPFNFIYKNIFGLATNSDLSELKNDFANMHARLKEVAETSMRNYKDLNTFVQIADQEIGNIKTHMKNVDNMMELLSNVTRDSSEYIDRQHLVVLSLIRDMYANTAFQSYMLKLEAIYSYINRGKLPPFLISDSHWKSIVKNVNHRLMAGHSTLRVPKMAPHTVHSHLKILWARIDKEILVTIEIPLVEMDHRYSIYEVNSFWTPTEQGSEASTKIDTDMLPKYLAISHSGSTYFEINSIDMDKDFLDEKDLVTGIRPRSTETCIWAITTDKRDLIKSLCKFNFRTSGLKPSAFRLANDKLLMIAVDSFKLDCGTIRETHSGCDACIFQIPNYCTITHDNFRFSAIENKGANMTSTGPIKEYLVNLPALEYLFNGELHDSLAGATTFRKPPVFNLRNLSGTIQEKQKSGNTEVKTGFYRERQTVSLHDLSQAIENRKPILNIHDSLHELRGEIFDHGSWRNIILCLNTVGTFLCITVSTFVIYRLLKINAILAILLNASPSVKGVQYDAWYVTPSSQEKPVIAPVNACYESNAAMIGVAVLITIYVLYKILNQIYKISRPPYVALELTSAKRTALVRIHDLSQSAFFYHFIGSQNIADVTLLGVFAPKIRFDAQDIRVKSLLKDKTVPLSSFARIGWFQALKIRNILGQQFSVSLILIDNDVKTYVRLCEPECDCSINLASKEQI